MLWIPDKARVLIGLGFTCVTIGVIAVFIKSDLFIAESALETLDTTTMVVTVPDEITTEEVPNNGRDYIRSIL